MFVYFCKHLTHAREVLGPLVRGSAQFLMIFIQRSLAPVKWPLVSPLQDKAFSLCRNAKYAAVNEEKQCQECAPAQTSTRHFIIIGFCSASVVAMTIRERSLRQTITCASRDISECSTAFIILANNNC